MNLKQGTTNQQGEAVVVAAPLYKRGPGAEQYPLLIAHLDEHREGLQAAIQGGGICEFLSCIPDGDYDIDYDSRDPRLVATIEGVGFMALDPHKHDAEDLLDLQRSLGAKLLPPGFGLRRNG